MIRSFLAVLAISAVFAALTGCASQRPNPMGSTPGAANDHSAMHTSAAHSSRSRSAAAICRGAFSGRRILGWADADVAHLRAYQYGGPIPHLPLRHAFGGVPAGTRGAWCWVLQSPGSASLWGALPGTQPRRAITVTGPGEGRYIGKMQGPPVVP
jgi:hypothetical protein